VPGVEDIISAGILKRFDRNLFELKTPRATVGDGNCSFRAVSLALYGTEDEHLFVRLLAACEIIEHQNYYDVTSTDFILSDDRINTSDIDAVINDVTTAGNYVELIHLYAISAVYKLPIQSYIPPVCAVGFNQSPYTTVIVGRGVRRTAAPAFTLMWTAMYIPQRGANFNANHIVLLVDREMSKLIDLSSGKAEFAANDASLQEVVSVASSLSSVSDVPQCENDDAAINIPTGKCVGDKQENYVFDLNNGTSADEGIHGEYCNKCIY
jgi:hypothetical protein